MTVKVTAKKLSEIRAEEKRLKNAKRRKKQSQQFKKAVAQPALSPLINFRTLDTLKEEQQARVVQAQKNQLPLEEYFVGEVEALDQTLTEILTAIQNMAQFRTRMQWDHFKTRFANQDVEVIETAIIELEKLNEGFATRIEDFVTTTCEELELQKVDPSREKLDVFTLKASTGAFVIFGEWNDTVIEKFHDINDLIENLKEGEPA